MKIVVNWGLCDGNGNCAAEAPELFRLTWEDTLQVLKETVAEDDRERAEAAVRACPKAALRLVD